MAAEYGYAGEILKVDLSRGAITKIPTAKYADRFLGGRGIATRIYWDEVPPETKAFDPENRLIFITGPLAGFTGLAGSRWQICGKSPATNPESFCYANLGGGWGASLKFAGYDGIVVHGKSEKPVYLYVNDGKAEIRDASSLWGKGTVEVREILQGTLGKEIRVAASGPAGDNMVVFANVLAHNDASASNGFGAVMGSKKLKAIAVGGNRKVVAADPARLVELRKYIMELSRDPVTMYACGYRTPLVTQNPKLKKYSCYGCIRGCIRANYIADNDKIGKYMCQSVVFYTGPALKYYGENNDVPFHASRLCDEYGLDVITTTEVLWWLRRCQRAGLLDDENTGLPLTKLGSLEFVEALVQKISSREGFGDTLAQGVFKAADLVGNGAREHIGDGVHSSGQSYFYGPRQYVIPALLYMTEPRVPWQVLHAITKPLHYWLDWLDKVEGAYVSTDVFRAMAKMFFGSEQAIDFSTYDGKALAAIKIQDREYAKECAILCDFNWPILLATHTPDHLGDPTLEGKLLTAVTGREMDEEGFYRVGERVFNLQRAILAREGHRGKENDVLPETDFTVPIKYSPPNPRFLVPGKNGEVLSRKDTTLDRKGFEKMRDDYYQLRGWDVASGLQTRKKLEEVGLGDITKSLETKGLIR